MFTDQGCESNQTKNFVSGEHAFWLPWEHLSASEIKCTYINLQSFATKTYVCTSFIPLKINLQHTPINKLNYRKLSVFGQFSFIT